MLRIEYLFSIAILIISANFLPISSSQAQNTLYTEVEIQEYPEFVRSASRDVAHSFVLYRMNIDKIRKRIRTRSGDKRIHIDLPWRGEERTFALIDHSVLAPGLAKKHPEISTFKGQTPNGQIEVRVSITPLGLQAIFFSKEGSSIIHPVDPSNDEYHYSYTLEEAVIPQEAIRCGNSMDPQSIKKELRSISSRNGGTRGESIQLRTYRLVIGSPAEYSSFAGGTLSSTLSSIANVVNSMNGYMNRAASVEFELIEETEELIFLDEDNDPYPNTNQAGAFLNENSGITSQYVDFDKYDVSHVFSVGCTGAAGISGSRIVCAQPSRKGAGVSCIYGSIFGFIMTTTHEFGHHLSASHTFNNCDNNNGQRSGATAFEPGSGTTIMSYAGACGSNNINGRDDYFHSANIEQMRTYVTEERGSQCGTLEDFGNTTPEVSIPREGGFFIPILTPFELTAEASDMEGDTVTYCWEEFDNGPITQLGNPMGDAPAFRSFPPTQNPTRIFPELKDILNDNNDPSEVLVDYSRDFDFRCTVRDNNRFNGGQDWDQIQFFTTEDAGPFKVLPLDSNIVQAGDYVELKWDVAGTDSVPVNCQKVDISMSTDGLQFDKLIREDAPNTGSAMITIPNTPTDEAWFKVKAAKNIFFNISPGDAIINASEEPRYLLSITKRDYELCLPFTAEIPLVTESLQGFDSEISFDVIDTLPGDIEAGIAPSTVSPGDTAILSVAFNNRPDDFDYTLTLRSVAENGDTLYRDISFQLTSTDFSRLQPTLPTSGSKGVKQAPLFSWDSSSTADSYTLQISLNPNFEELVFEESDIQDTSYSYPDLLPSGTLYYWRVVPVNKCGKGHPSATSAFQTKLVDCQIYLPEDLPKNISTSQGATVNSTIEISGGGSIEDVNIPNVSGNHQYIGDIKTRLISPSGTVVKLWSRECFNGSNFNLGFDDDSPKEISCPLTSAGIVKPQEPLSKFEGEDPSGEWTLRIQDVVAGSGGSLNDWKLELCSSASANPPFVVRNDTLAVPRDTTRRIRSEFHLLVDDNNTPPEKIRYTLVKAPSHGTLNLYGDPLEVGDHFTQRQIYDWYLSYTHDGSSFNNDQFHFVAEDDDRGWTGIHQFNIKVDSSIVLDINDPAKVRSLSVHPNPTAHKLMVDLPERIDQGMLEIVDINGRIAYRELFKWSGQSTHVVDVQSWSSGMYFIRLQSEKQVYQARFIVE